MTTDTPGAPGAPSIVETKRRAVTLKWSTPREDGGTPLTSYVVQYRPEGAYKWITSTEDTTSARHEVTGLEENITYDFRVAGKNKMGVGKFAECAMAVQAREPIGG